MRIVGDIHGKIPEYLKVVKDAPCSIQIGDMGLGFKDVNLPASKNHLFIRGNHDSPDLCRKHPSYLGEFGIHEVDNFKCFFLSGAWSIDYKHRIVDISWWADEELSQEQLDQAFKLYQETKPEIVITHDTPECVSRMMVERFSPFYVVGENGEHKGNFITTRTAVNLDKMFHEHQPTLWVFGHYHANWNGLVAIREGVVHLLRENEIIHAVNPDEGTLFVCLAELQYIDI